MFSFKYVDSSFIDRLHHVLEAVRNKKPKDADSAGAEYKHFCLLPRQGVGGKNSHHSGEYSQSRHADDCQGYEAPGPPNVWFSTADGLGAEGLENQLGPCKKDLNEDRDLNESDFG